MDLLPLVKRVAFNIRGHMPTQVEAYDLIGNRGLGLMGAVGEFDPAKEPKLESYARRRIRGVILDGLRRGDPASRDLRRKYKRIQELYHELEVKSGCRVQDDEMAKALGVNLTQWHRTLKGIQAAGLNCSERALSAGPTSKQLTHGPEFLANEAVDPFVLCAPRAARNYGSGSFPSGGTRKTDRHPVLLAWLTLNQIAGQLGVDASRVSQIHSAALARLMAGVHCLVHLSAHDEGVE
jgi:RNA polymerase sigma factor for flagellar operon FliA